MAAWDEMFTIEPPSPAAMRVPNAAINRNGPFTLTAITLSNRSSVMVSTDSYSGEMPALLTRMSTPPQARSTSVTSRSHSSQWLTLQAMARVRRPNFSSTSFANSSHASSLRLEMTTSAPASAKANTMLRPRPRLPPVTSARRPVRSNRSPTAQPSRGSVTGTSTVTPRRRADRTTSCHTTSACSAVGNPTYTVSMRSASWMRFGSIPSWSAPCR